MTPSLSNFITSLFAGLFLVIVPIGAAVVTVSRNDTLAREEA
jgi:hypothetical protein